MVLRLPAHDTLGSVGHSLLAASAPKLREAIKRMDRLMGGSAEAAESARA
ncbi:hypothetical protein [Actinocrinis sp.]|nr:hypothetical protein [Actinocrinis sp.]